MAITVINKNPDEAVDLEHSGSDTTRRYLYQAAYAALQAVLIVQDNPIFKEIYCEQQEDVLIKLFDDSFIGIQVKSQDEEFGGFRFTDERILKAIARFINHELTFPNKFKEYVFCTNCGFLKRSDHTDLPFCLNLLKKNNNNLDECYKEANFYKNINKLSELSGVQDTDIITKVLNKIAMFKWASLRDYKEVLSAEIGSKLGLESKSQVTLKRAAEALMSAAIYASEYRDTNIQPTYHNWINNREEALISEIMAKKRITKEMVSNILSKYTNSSGLLQGVAPISVSTLPRGASVLTQKLEEGKVCVNDINTMKDCDNSSFILFREWYEAYGKDELDARCDHLRIIVQRECQDVYNRLLETETDPFGQKMLGIVRDRFRERIGEIQKRYDDCSSEHLEGIAAILSEKCTLWWSKEFKLKEDLNGPT